MSDLQRVAKLQNSRSRTSSAPPRSATKDRLADLRMFRGETVELLARDGEAETPGISQPKAERSP